MQELWSAISELLGLGNNPDSFTTGQMALRSAVVYLVTVGVARFAGKRFFGEHTAFDVVLGIILGSVLSRAINGSAPFFQTLVAGAVLVILHVLFAMIAFHTHKFGAVIKGEPRQLIEEGELLWEAMRHSRLSRRDLISALRLKAQLSDPEQVKAAYIERNGQISVIPAGQETQVVEVDVEAGVQTIRIELYPN